MSPLEWAVENVGPAESAGYFGAELFGEFVGDDLIQT